MHLNFELRLDKQGSLWYTFCMKPLPINQEQTEIAEMYKHGTSIAEIRKAFSNLSNNKLYRALQKAGIPTRKTVDSRPRLAPGQAVRNFVLRSYRIQAERRNLNWSLSDEQFDALLRLPCYYCGVCFSNSLKIGNGRFEYNGIDRLVNSEGYSPENCVACCKTHNRMKMGQSAEEFLNACQAVVGYFGKRTVSWNCMFSYNKL